MELIKKCVNCENEVENDSDLCEECEEELQDYDPSEADFSSAHYEEDNKC